MTSTWEEVAAAKRRETYSSKPVEWRIHNIPQRQDQKDVTGHFICQYLSDEEIEITEADAVDIAKKLASGQWRAYDVTKAFCHRAALAHQLTPCLLEIFFDRALDRARELDEEFSKTGKPTGVLHGVPISLKDQFHVKGVETSLGWIGWINTFEGRKGTGLERNVESVLTEELLSMGAVLYCKTSVPHSLMAAETVNHIAGYTWNPNNRLLSSGGSSGGEAALISMKGSPLGFGTDLAGSVRIPAAYNGLYGLLPSAGRIPYDGTAKLTADKTPS